ncbi:hypothetical protein [Nostoc sp.]
MKLKFTLRIIGCTLLAVLTPTVLTAQTLPYRTARTPHTCPSMLEPKTGAPSVEQAKMYFLCDQEWQFGTPGQSSSYLSLVNDLTLEVAPISRPANRTDLKFNRRHGGEHLSINTDQPVYDIRGSYTSYSCFEIKRYHPVRKNCIVYQFSNSSGICFRNTFGDWHCRMIGSLKEIGQHLPPPEN